MAMVGFFENNARLIGNTLDEVRDVIVGKDMKGSFGKWVVDNDDRTPFGYFFTKLIPGVNAGVDFFDVYDNFTYKKR